MTIHAYNSVYLGKAARAVGNMLHDATVSGYDGADFLDRFIQSDVAGQIEIGNPKYAAGKSGQELFFEVIERTCEDSPVDCLVANLPIESYERSDAYWVGWMLAHYQWYSGRSFRDILETVPYNELLGLYGTLHEADIQKSYEVLDAHFYYSESKLKRIRRQCSLTQEELSELSGVSLNTIRSYEQKTKDIKKAQADILLDLAAALKCSIMDLLD